ncbi:hypothetical protein L917_09963 [Phytophthora nicotianae]|uniref:Uncharacterized protein n=1 Tax=Phytophthora nicotianae TaxID=4792 RepID=W2HT81_PHYNI|nr:hypothetical protein L915_21816 [Phytophthora nicotianae]ETL24358.1 hypothetical protein L916_21628 [Phytophthora nicotianae]ETL91493.1 hypothetical protein L917_09963 [Phytophthora nicotianae]
MQLVQQSRSTPTPGHIPRARTSVSNHLLTPTHKRSSHCFHPSTESTTVQRPLMQRRQIAN